MAQKEDPEALRRRLYRPGASEDDRRRYLATLPVAEVEPEQPVRPAPPSSRMPVVLPVVVLALVIAGAIALARTATEPSIAEPSPVASVAEQSPKTILPSRQVVVAMNGLSRTATRVTGSGSAEVPLDVSTASFTGGRLVVLLSSTDERPVGWRALTFETERDPIPFQAVTASQPPRDREGATRADVAVYRSAPPTELQIQAPPDAVWTLTVAFDTGRH